MCFYRVLLFLGPENTGTLHLQSSWRWATFADPRRPGPSTAHGTRPSTAHPRHMMWGSAGPGFTEPIPLPFGDSKCSLPRGVKRERARSRDGPRPPPPSV
eukprot:gene16294-biopygen20262